MSGTPHRLSSTNDPQLPYFQTIPWCLKPLSNIGMELYIIAYHCIALYIIVYHIYPHLVGGFNHLEKYESQWKG